MKYRTGTVGTVPVAYKSYIAGMKLNEDEKKTQLWFNICRIPVPVPMKVIFYGTGTCTISSVRSDYPDGASLLCSVVVDLKRYFCRILIHNFFRILIRVRIWILRLPVIFQPDIFQMVPSNAFIPV
jgi:hypothetical protein